MSLVASPACLSSRPPARSTLADLPLLGLLEWCLCCSDLLRRRRCPRWRLRLVDLLLINDGWMMDDDTTLPRTRTDLLFLCFLWSCSWLRLLDCPSARPLARSAFTPWRLRLVDLFLMNDGDDAYTAMLRTRAPHRPASVVMLLPEAARLPVSSASSAIGLHALAAAAC
jgi:hypothetical protein